MSDFLKRLCRNRVATACMVFIIMLGLLGAFAPLCAPHDPYISDILNKFQSPSLVYPFGTDNLGRRVFSRMLYGIRATLFLSLLVMVGTMVLGIAMGVLAGYAGGVVDSMIMRIVDMVLSFPSLIMILAVVALLGVDIWNVVIANILIKWAWYARMIRSAVISCVHVNFIEFSKTIGSGHGYILLRHVIPSIASELAVLATLNAGWAVLNISTLSFLGLGVQAPPPEWGAMLRDARNVMISRPEQMIIPGITLIMLVASFHLLGDGLRDALDSREGGS